MKNHFALPRNEKKTAYLTILAGVCGAVVITMLITILETILTEKQLMDFGVADVLAKVVWTAAAFCGGLLTAGKGGKNGILPSAVTGLCYGGMLLLLSAIFCKARFSNAMTGLGIAVVSAAAGGAIRTFWKVGRKKNYHYHKKF